jgi:PadR family transcriptional regulator AphA
MTPQRDDLDLAEHTCLALVAEGIDHGWAIGSLLAADGPLGRIWTLSRPLTYRAVDQLVERRLVSRRGTAQGRGRQRSLLRATSAGRRVAGDWLDRPVGHLRDVRTELLLKLALRQRAGLGNDQLLVDQREQFAEVIASLTAADSVDAVARWRGENARATRRFLDGELFAVRRAGSGRAAPTELRLSARNQLRATVEHVDHGDVVSAVRTRLPDGQSITAVITNDALADLDIAEGDAVLVIVKSTEAMLAT